MLLCKTKNKTKNKMDNYTIPQFHCDSAKVAEIYLPRPKTLSLKRAYQSLQTNLKKQTNKQTNKKQKQKTKTKTKSKTKTKLKIKTNQKTQQNKTNKQTKNGRQTNTNYSLRPYTINKAPSKNMAYMLRSNKYPLHELARPTCALALPISGALLGTTCKPSPKFWSKAQIQCLFTQ